MSNVASLPPTDIDSQMLKVARAIAVDLHPIREIMSIYGIDQRTLDTWNKHPRFQSYLVSEAEAWNAATNTAERVKLKAAMVMEEFMLKAHGELHDARQGLNHRVELAKLVAKIAGVDGSRAGSGGPGEGGGGFKLVINIGEGRKATKVEAAIPMRTIEHDENDGTDPDNLVTLDY